MFKTQARISNSKICIQDLHKFPGPYEDHYYSVSDTFVLNNFLVSRQKMMIYLVPQGEIPSAQTGIR